MCLTKMNFAVGVADAAESSMPAAPTPNKEEEDVQVAARTTLLGSLLYQVTKSKAFVTTLFLVVV
jgi:hypothetical protein